MKAIPLKMREKMDSMYFYHICARNHAFGDHICKANPMTGQPIEWEHALTYKGQRVNEIWAIIPLCWWAHSGGGLVKDIGKWIAVNRATQKELKDPKYSKNTWEKDLLYLNGKYGGYSMPKLKKMRE